MYESLLKFIIRSCTDFLTRFLYASDGQMLKLFQNEIILTFLE